MVMVVVMPTMMMLIKVDTMILIITLTTMMLTIKVDTSSRYHGAGYFLYPCTSGYTQVGAWLGLLMKMKNV